MGESMSCDEDHRCHCLPGWGTALISSDLHGNGQDFRTLRDIFLARRAETRDVHWVVLGDAIHAPNSQARQEEPELYDYPDASGEIIEGLIELDNAHPGHIHFLLGNHEHAHIGGPSTGKFHGDEAAHLHEQLDPAQIERMHHFYRHAPLLAVAPCGVVLCHGSPDDSLRSLEDLAGISYDASENTTRQNAILQSCLNSYGQSSEVTARFLAAISDCTGFDLYVVIHGHDRDEAGWFAEGGNQLCPVIFGAPQHQKRYLELDLGRRYETLEQFRDGIEIRRLHV